MKLYKFNCYEAFRADEKGIYWATEIPKDTIHYKYEILGEIEVEDLDTPFIIYTDDESNLPLAETTDKVLKLNMETHCWETL